MLAHTRRRLETRKTKGGGRGGRLARFLWHSPDSSHGESSRGSSVGRRARAAQIQSIAVLPLQNLSGDPTQEYFADGMTEQLIADLATIDRLRVISRTSVMPYKDAPKPVPVIARELQVDAVIEGSVARDGGKVQITTTLIRGATGAIIWAQKFERDASDVLTLQREVVQTITSKVDITLTPLQQTRIASARPIDPDRDFEVLLGRHHAAKATEESLRKAVQYFDAAIAKDPANAWAHAGLAEAYTGLAGFYMDPREAMPKAKQAAETALRLDEALADAHAALGYVHLVWDWDGPAAQKALLRALDLNPSLATARLNYAAYLTTQARHDEAVQEIRRALNLDPRSIRSHAQGTVLLIFTRHFDEAIELARRGLEFEPNSGFTLAFQGVAYAELGRFDEAIDNLQRAIKLDNSLTVQALHAQVLAVAGRTEEAKAVLASVEKAARSRYFCPYEIGSVHATLGDADAAFKFFRKGTDERADCMAWLGVEPWLDRFRLDSRYRDLLRDIGLTPATRTAVASPHESPTPVRRCSSLLLSPLTKVSGLDRPARKGGLCVTSSGANWAAAGFVAAWVSFVSPVFASADTRVVHPGQSIQAAVNASDPGDTVVVKAGTYYQSVRIATDGITLRAHGQVTLKPSKYGYGECYQSGNAVGICVSSSEFDPGTRAIPNGSTTSPSPGSASRASKETACLALAPRT